MQSFTKGLVFALCLILQIGYTQSFEGTLTIITDDRDDLAYIVDIFGEKSIARVEVDSAESITLIRNHATEVSTILKRKGDMKYGFSKTIYFDTDHITNEKYTVPTSITFEITEERKYINGYNCVRMLIEDAHGAAEAWITTDIPIHLSTYYPQLLGGDIHGDLIPLRRVADREGFIMTYHETHNATGQTSQIKVNVDAKELSSNIFHVASEYFILDEEGMKRLYMQSQTDASRKTQWEEFMILFGK